MPLTPAAVGFLASLGITEIPARPKPTVAIIITGKEIVQPGTPLQYGGVYDANTYTITAVLKQLHITHCKISYVTDDVNDIETALQASLQQAHIVLLSGGISAGDYDFVPEAAKRCAIKEVLYKVAQKPGKPLFFGTKENKLIFGLPGNPAATLTCMYEYVVPAIDAIAAMPATIKTLHLPLTKSFTKQRGKALFLKGISTCNAVDILPAQESYKLQSFAYANCLVFLAENITAVAAGELVEVHLLPPAW